MVFSAEISCWIIAWRCYSRYFLHCTPKCVSDSKVQSFLFYSLIFYSGECCRIRRSFRRIETEDFPERKRILSMPFRLQPRFTLGTCPFTQRRSKFTSSSLALGKSRRSLWVWTRTPKHPVASVSFCEYPLHC